MKLGLTDSGAGRAASLGNPDVDDVDFRALLSASPNPYVLLDGQFRIRWMNDAYLRATMRRREDILGRAMFDAFPSTPGSESFRLLDSSLRRTFETGQPDEIALIRYDIASPDGTMEQRYWSATHTPMRGHDGRVAYVLQHTVDVTELHGLRRLRDETGVVQRAHAVQTRNLDLLEETSHFKNLFEQAPGFIAILTGREHRFVLANRAYREMVGRQDIIGLSVAEAIPEVIEQGFVAVLDQVLATGQPYLARREKVLLAGDGPASGRAFYLNFIFQPIAGQDGEITGVFVQGHDETEEVEAEERQALMINELNHRVKNTLAIVQGLAMQSFRQIPGSEAARATFDARLRALSAAHNLLTERKWEASRLSDTVRNSVEATTGVEAERFRFDGPDIMLAPQTAVSLAMLLHELSTNAIKYGALSQPGGTVNVTWTIEPAGQDGDRLCIDWRESGGPPVQPPTRRGFGTRLIERGMSGELGSEVRLDFRPEGLRCEITACLRESRPA